VTMISPENFKKGEGRRGGEGHVEGGRREGRFLFLSPFKSKGGEKKKKGGKKIHEGGKKNRGSQ